MSIDEKLQKEPSSSIVALAREPLIHFLLIGAALFVVFGLVNEKYSSEADKQVVVSAGRIAQLENIFTKTWQRPPTAEELKGLIDDFVLEEIYYRQAVAMGIDRDDTVIRRRLRQKFEFLTDDIVATTPSDEELTRYLAANPDKFLRDTTYTFEQIYINPDRRGVDLESHIASQLSALRAGKVVDGDSGLLPTLFDATPGRVIDSNFGSDFSTKLDMLPLGEWRGPIESGIGLHLMRMNTRVTGTVPDLAEIRPIVEREWAHEKRLKSRRLINEKLLNDYDVVIEWPKKQSAELAESK